MDNGQLIIDNYFIWFIRPVSSFIKKEKIFLSFKRDSILAEILIGHQINSDGALRQRPAKQDFEPRRNYQLSIIHYELSILI